MTDFILLHCVSKQCSLDSYLIVFVVFAPKALEWLRVRARALYSDTINLMYLPMERITLLSNNKTYNMNIKLFPIDHRLGLEPVSDIHTHIQTDITHTHTDTV